MPKTTTRKLKTFDVDVCRIAYGNLTIRVQAPNAVAAKLLAEDNAGGESFTEHTSKYEAQSVTEVKEV